MKSDIWNRLSFYSVIFCVFLAFFININYKTDVIEIASWGKNIYNDAVLIIDPGHGGDDGGAVSVNGIYESDINLDIALKLEQLAGFCGIAPVMTRNTAEIDYPEDASSIRARKTADQKNRVELINSVGSAVLISIHQNKYTTSGPSGAQVLYAPTDGSAEFASCLQELFVSELDPGNRRKAAQISGDIYLMNNISCTAVLVECGFLSNIKEASLLESDNYRLKVASIIMAGYLSHFKASEKTGGYI